MLADFLLVVDFRGVAGVRGAVELDARPHELRGVLVGRRHVDVETGGSALHRERSHDVVCLKALNTHDGNP